MGGGRRHYDQNNKTNKWYDASRTIYEFEGAAASLEWDSDERIGFWLLVLIFAAKSPEYAGGNDGK